MRQRRKFYRPSIERLERRDTPSNFSVAFNPATHTLNIIGTGQNDTITVEGNASDATMFALSSSGGDTFNNHPTFNSPSGVQNIMMTLLGGNTVSFEDDVVPIDLQGSLTINGGNGGSVFTSFDMSVGKNVTITNGNGDTTTTIERDAAGFSSIGGNLSITNEAGVDYNSISDTNIGGNVTVNNGHDDGTNAGFTAISNQHNTTVRSLIKGSVNVSYLDGSNTPGIDDAICDAEVKGNVTFNHGSASITTDFDGDATSLPVLIDGNLTMTGSGANTITIGTKYKGTGMIVGGSFTVATPATTPLSSPVTTLNFANLQVGLATSLGLGNGGDSVTINTSTFLGAFSLTTGAGNDHAVMTTVDVNGNLTVGAGSGANSFTATGLQVGGNLAVSSVNTVATHAIDSTLTNLTVNGAVTINNGNGSTDTTLNRTGTGFNDIGGNLSITNAVGYDENIILDTNIGGNVTVNNGHGDGTYAGFTSIINSFNTTVRSVIKGSVSISYLDGNHVTSDGIHDTQIDGNVTIAAGTGTFFADFDGYETPLPVFILGNLGITGSGTSTVNVGTTIQDTGLIVGGSFTIATPATTPPSAPVGTLDFNKLQVGTATNIALGAGADSVTITTSTFLGAFTLTTGAGNDTVTMTTVEVNGNLTVNGGAGANTFTATGLQVGGSLAISSANTLATNAIHSTLTDLNVNGSVTINDGNGNTDTTINRDAVGFNAIGANLSITNGTGADDTTVNDTNVGGAVTVNNGKGSVAGAGDVEIFNIKNTSTRAEIKGNVSVSYLTGSADDSQGISDTEVGGNVTFANGTGSFATNLDGYSVLLPVIIHGNLTVSGSGANTVTAGTYFSKTGLIVGGNFTIATPATMPPGSPVGTLHFFQLQVTGKTNITLGNGNDSVTIDDSVFHGAFTLTTGTGNDTVNIETTAGTAAPTIFDAPVLINLGAGNDTVNREGNTDAKQEIIFFDTFVIHHGAGNNAFSYTPVREIAPFGTVVQWIM